MKYIFQVEAVAIFLSSWLLTSIIVSSVQAIIIPQESRRYSIVDDNRIALEPYRNSGRVGLPNGSQSRFLRVHQVQHFRISSLFSCELCWLPVIVHTTVTRLAPRFPSVFFSCGFWFSSGCLGVFRHWRLTWASSPQFHQRSSLCFLKLLEDSSEALHFSFDRVFDHSPYFDIAIQRHFHGLKLQSCNQHIGRSFCSGQ